MRIVMHLGAWQPLSFTSAGSFMSFSCPELAMSTHTMSTRSMTAKGRALRRVYVKWKRGDGRPLRFREIVNDLEAVQILNLERYVGDGDSGMITDVEDNSDGSGTSSTSPGTVQSEDEIVDLMMEEEQIERLMETPFGDRYEFVDIVESDNTSTITTLFPAQKRRLTRYRHRAHKRCNNKCNSGPLVIKLYASSKQRNILHLDLTEIVDVLMKEFAKLLLPDQVNRIWELLKPGCKMKARNTHTPGKWVTIASTSTEVPDEEYILDYPIQLQETQYSSSHEANDPEESSGSLSWDPEHCMKILAYRLFGSKCKPGIQDDFLMNIDLEETTDEEDCPRTRYELNLTNEYRQNGDTTEQDGVSIRRLKLLWRNEINSLIDMLADWRLRKVAWYVAYEGSGADQMINDNVEDRQENMKSILINSLNSINMGSEAKSNLDIELQETTNLLCELEDSENSVADVSLKFVNEHEDSFPSTTVKSKNEIVIKKNELKFCNKGMCKKIMKNKNKAVMEIVENKLNEISSVSNVEKLLISWPSTLINNSVTTKNKEVDEIVKDRIKDLVIEKCVQSTNQIKVPENKADENYNAIVGDSQFPTDSDSVNKIKTEWEKSTDAVIADLEEAIVKSYGCTNINNDDKTISVQTLINDTNISGEDTLMTDLDIAISGPVVAMCDEKIQEVRKSNNKFCTKKIIQHIVRPKRRIEENAIFLHKMNAKLMTAIEVSNKKHQIIELSGEDNIPNNPHVTQNSTVKNNRKALDVLGTSGSSMKQDKSFEFFEEMPSNHGNLSVGVNYDEHPSEIVYNLPVDNSIAGILQEMSLRSVKRPEDNPKRRKSALPNRKRVCKTSTYVKKEDKEDGDRTSQQSMGVKGKRRGRKRKPMQCVYQPRVLRVFLKKIDGDHLLTNAEAQQDPNLIKVLNMDQTVRIKQEKLDEIPAALFNYNVKHFDRDKTKVVLRRCPETVIDLTLKSHHIEEIMQTDFCDKYEFIRYSPLPETIEEPNRDAEAKPELIRKPACILDGMKKGTKSINTLRRKYAREIRAFTWSQKSQIDGKSNEDEIETDKQHRDVRDQVINKTVPVPGSRRSKMSENGDEILHYKKRIIQMHENPINRDENSNLDGAEARGKRDDDEETGGGKNKRKESDSEDWESQRQDKSGEHQPKRRKNARNLAFSHEKLELYKLGESRNSTTLCKTKEGYRASQEKILRSTSQTGPEPRVTTQQLTDSILLSLGVDKTKDQESEETNNLTENLVRRLSRENSIDNSIQTTVIRKECSLINSAEITNKVEPIIAPINQTNTEKVLQETNSNTTIKPLSPETKSHLPPRKPSFGMEAILEDVRQTSFPLKHTATITHIPSNNLNEIEDRFIDHNERQGLKVTRVTYRPPSPKFFGQPEVNYPPSASQCSAMDLTLPVKEPVLNKTKKTERQDTRVVEEKIRKVQELESGTRIRVSKSLLNRPVPVTPVSTQYLPPNHRNVVSPKHQQPLLWCGQNEVAQRNRISPREAMIPPNSYVLPMQNYPPEPSRFSFHPDATGIGVPSWHGFPSPEISPSYLPQRDLFLNVRPESEPAVFYGRPEQTVKRQRGRPKGAVKKKKPEVQSVIMSPPQTPNGLRHPAFSPFHLPVQRPLEINNNTHPGTINQCLTSSNDSFCESDEKSSPNSHSRTVPSISAAHVNRMKTMFCGSKHLDATLERVNEQVFMFFSKHFNNACTDSFLKQLIAKCNSIFKSLILHLINMQSNSNNTSFVGTLNISTLKSDINTSLSNVKRNCELDINYLAKNFHIELLNVKKMDGLDLISHEPFITAVVDHLGNHIQTKFSHEVDFLSFKMFEIMVVKPPKNTPPHSPQSNTSPITVRSTDSLKNPSPICISERSNDGSELAETHKPTDSGYEGSVGKPLDEENSQITIIEDSQDTSHNSVASDKSGLKERMIEDISEDEVATTPLKPPETFPFLRSDSRLSVESISSSSDAGAASKPQKVVNVEKPYSKRIPKGKLCYIREQHYFIRYFDEAQIHLFIENLKKSDQSYNVKDIYKQCYKNGIRPEHVENVQNQMFKTGKEIIKVPPDCEFSDKDILAKPDEYVTEYNMVHKYVPEDFFWYYKFVTGYQIYRGNIPISFQTFLTMHNTNGLKVLFNNYINNLEQKYRETTTNNVSS